VRRACWAYAVILCCLGSPARSAGIQLLDSDPSLAGAIWYPCAAEPQRVPLGRLTVQFIDSIQGVKDCPVTGAKLPLVIVSHGRGGWFGLHHDVEEALADAGFVVAAINHPGDNGNDSSKRDTLSLWESRPKDVVRLLDFMLNDWKDRAAIDPTRIGFFGFSFGGYTGLVLAGAKPDFGRFAHYCTDKTGVCEQLHNGETPPNTMRVSGPRSLRIHRVKSSRRTIWRRSRSPSSSGDQNAEAWGRRALNASPAASQASRTFTSSRPVTTDFYRPARHSSRQTCRASVPIRPASTEQPFTASSTRALFGSFANISSNRWPALPPLHHRLEHAPHLGLGFLDTRLQRGEIRRVAGAGHHAQQAFARRLQLETAGDA
jgi:predicted dienelactone hydrolase